MKNLRLITCLLSVIATWQRGAEAQNNPMDVFKPFPGDWTTASEIRPSAGNPEKSDGTGELTGKMILGGRYLQLDGFSVSARLGRQDYKVILTWDERLKAYRRWVFRSDGMIAESQGTWDAARKTLTWSTVGLPEGATFTVTTRITDDRIEETLLGKRADGAVSMDLTMTATRKR